MPTFISADGTQQDVKLDATIWLEAQQQNLSLPELINRKFPTALDAKGSTFEQMCASSGLILAKDREFGYRPPTIGAVLDGRAMLNGASVADANPASRILYPAVFLELIENKLAVDRTTDPNAFDEMIGIETSVTSARIEQPVINLEKAEGARAKAISQLAEPNQMLTITTADQAKKIPVFSLGLEVSDQALQATTLDFVSMAVTRQAEVERNARVYEYLLGMLNGDTDEGTSALPVVKMDVYDSTISADGAITKLGLLNYLMHNYFTRRISHMVCNSDTALKIHDLFNTTNTNQQVPGALGAQFRFMNRDLSNINIFVCEASAGWTANTIMGLDKRYAMQRIRNTAASYSAIENFVLRKATKLRFDFSEIVVRVFPDAFDVVALINT